MNVEKMQVDTLITGATAGIGHELARCFAKNGHGVALVARTRDRLDSVAEELSSGYGVNAIAIVADLSDPAAPQAIYDRIQGEGLEIGYVVNNAGFGVNGKFAETNLATELNMMQVNMGALVALTKLFMAGMIARKQGRIMNVASTASFQPGPNMAIYCATKAFVLSFSEAIAVELKRSGVTVTALCPGGTETEFQSRAEIHEIPLVKNGLRPLMKGDEVAEQGYNAMMKGERVCVTGLMNKILAASIRVTPRKVAAELAGRLMERPH
jgi:hypothetical protein